MKQIQAYVSPDLQTVSSVRALETAATDDRVKAVVLDLDRFMGGGQVAMGDIADAIDKVRKANKPVLAYATGYSDRAYQLAAHASEEQAPTAKASLPEVKSPQISIGRRWHRPRAGSCGRIATTSSSHWG